MKTVCHSVYTDIMRFDLEAGFRRCYWLIFCNFSWHLFLFLPSSFSERAACNTSFFLTQLHKLSALFIHSESFLPLACKYFERDVCRKRFEQWALSNTSKGLQWIPLSWPLSSSATGAIESTREQSLEMLRAKGVNSFDVKNINKN